jgi:hypothetical protein
VYNALQNGSVPDVLWFVVFNFTVTMFLTNFIIAHVLNTFALLSDYVGDNANANRVHTIEHPLPVSAQPDAVASTFPVRVSKRPSLMKIWQAGLELGHVRRAFAAAAQARGIRVPVAVSSGLHLSFLDFLARRCVELHQRNIAVRVENTRAGQPAAAAAPVYGAMVGPQ